MEYSYKFRIYPNKAQANQIQRTFGCARFAYNYYLTKRKEVFEQTGKTMSYYDCTKDLTALKQTEDMLWLCEVDATALTTSLKDLDMAYQNFFRGLKKGTHVGYPKFKSKRADHQSYRTNRVRGNIKVLDNAVQLPKLGEVKCRVHRVVVGRILSATVSQNPSGKYFVSICCADVEIAPLERTDKVCGVALGTQDFAVTSEGVTYPNNKHLAQAEKKLARLQRQLSRKPKGSNNRGKAKVKVARLQEYIANQRRDTMHKVSTELVRNYDVICMEDPAVKGMMRDSSYTKSIANASWSEFCRQLEYKADWYGKTVSVVDCFYPSSQLCSYCGTQWAGIKNTKVRQRGCPSCGAKRDSDFNAAINIKTEGVRILT